MDPTLPLVPLGRLAEVARGEIRGDPDVLVRDVSYDSRDAVAGGLFFCVPGAVTDGHAFAAEAVRAGATALIVERWLDLGVPQVRVEAVRPVMGPLSAVLFGRPADDLVIVGITGTNGKTTSTYLLEAVFRGAGLRPGVLGTTGARIDGTPEQIARTTPEAPDLHRLLRRMRSHGVDAAAIEVSSHALDQHRVDGVVFDVAQFTNLSQDHLDYHGTMEAYFEAKARLFEPGTARRGAVNVDDVWGKRLRDAVSIPVLSYGEAPGADLRAVGVRSDADGVSFRVGDVAVRSPLRGSFNVENCLGVLAVATALHLDLATAAEAIASVPGVPGRFEPVEAGQDFLVVVDYAHTPDSIHSVLRGARPLAMGRVIVVFGCGGDRDRSKRPLMGEAATSHADLTILTSDNPRHEDPQAIIEDVLPGARAGGGDFVIEADRRAAIKLAVSAARAGDVVVIAGKGHETSQEIGDRVIAFDDRDVAHAALTSLGGTT